MNQTSRHGSIPAERLSRNSLKVCSRVVAVLAAPALGARSRARVSGVRQVVRDVGCPDGPHKDMDIASISFRACHWNDDREHAENGSRNGTR